MRNVLAVRTLVVVTGASCAGKTTLAAALGLELSLPVVHRDVLKEALFDTLGTRDREWSRTLGGASYKLLFTVLESLLRAGCSSVIESNFEAARHGGHLRGLCKRYGFTPFEILCTADLETLRRRYHERLSSRHAGHVDHVNEATNEVFWTGERHGFLELGGRTLRVDTARFGRLEQAALIDDLKAGLAPQEER